MIRGGLEIPDPFWTYCANHPHRNPSLLQVPLGPVFRSLEDDPPEGEVVDIVGDRWVWRRSPDTPAVRETLLKILADAAEGPRAEYPLGVTLTEAAIWQVAEFREQRAVPHLERIALATADHELGDFGGSQVVRLAPFATEALRRIAGG